MVEHALAAGVRDALAAERTRLANERTLLAYARTSLALVVAGVTGGQLLANDVLGGISYIVAGIGVATFVVGAARFATVNRRMKMIVAAGGAE